METKLGVDWMMHVALPWLNPVVVVLTHWIRAVLCGVLGLVILMPCATWVNVTWLRDLMVPNVSGDRVSFWL